MCEGQVYDDYGFYETEPTITTKHLKTVFGCDSIITLDLKMQSPYTDTIYATIGEGGCYNKYGFYECDEGIYTMNYTTSQGASMSSVNGSVEATNFMEAPRFIGDLTGTADEAYSLTWAYFNDNGTIS
jgi:hypothetical protein